VVWRVWGQGQTEVEQEQITAYSHTLLLPVANVSRAPWATH
jgi:hypothetical protein